ncbi:conidiation-specific protein (con-13) [Neurospora tetraspora]|uniref:Conidiation-specific protein (Con-13) n=1 Tax=Neurospora tetraspora TaxID=94610 RepID=A0AAE0MMY5_9PEZI|nr:conidiation-specific protein (con-13) [Neurospora tetraspora]
MLQAPFFALLLAAVVPAVLADGPPETMGENFSGLSVLDSPGGLQSLTPAPYTKSQWPWGTVPKLCYDTAVNNKYCNPYDLEVYDVTYSDCPIPTTVCRCNNSPMAIDTIAQRVGQLPVKARQWNGYVSSFAGDICSAYSDSFHNYFFGDCGNSESVFFHELSHNLDRHVAGASINDWYSLSQNWKDTVTKGTCVADHYSKSSWLEAYAQVGVMAGYHGTVQSIYTKNVSCMVDQVNKVVGQLDSLWRKKPGQMCDRYWIKDTTVCMGPDAEASGNCPAFRAADAAEVDGVGAVKVPVLPDEKQKKHDAVVKELQHHAEVAAGISPGKPAAEKKTKGKKGTKFRA